MRISLLLAFLLRLFVPLNAQAIISSENLIQTAQMEHFEAQTRYAPLSIQALAHKDSLNKYLGDLLPWIERFSKSYSYDGPLDSLVYHSKVGTEHKLDSVTTQLLRYGEWAYNQTNKGIDVGIGNLLKAWKIGWQQK